MDLLVSVMLVWASYLSGYSMPDIQPTIIPVSHQYFVEHVCHNVDTEEHPCHYVGLYTYDEKTIRIDQGMSKTEFDAILIHELVHYLQHTHDKYVNDTCDNRKAREHEAYKIEQQYIDKTEKSERTISPPSDEEICSLD